MFCCHVIGPQEAGKSSFLKGFVGKTSKAPTPDASQRISDLPKFAINTLKIYNQEKYLIVSLGFAKNHKNFKSLLIKFPLQLREVDLFQVDDHLSEPELICDVICMMYDGSDPYSFEYIASIFLVSRKNWLQKQIPKAYFSIAEVL